MLDERIVQELAQIVGADNVSADTADRILHLTAEGLHP